MHGKELLSDTMTGAGQLSKKSYKVLPQEHPAISTLPLLLIDHPENLLLSFHPRQKRSIPESATMCLPLMNQPSGLAGGMFSPKRIPSEVSHSLANEPWIFSVTIAKS